MPHASAFLAMAYLAQAAALGFVFAQLFDLGAADRVSPGVRRRLHGRMAAEQACQSAHRHSELSAGELSQCDAQYSY